MSLSFDLAIVCENLGMLQSETADRLESIRSFQQAVDILQKLAEIRRLLLTGPS